MEDKLMEAFAALLLDLKYSADETRKRSKDPHSLATGARTLRLGAVVGPAEGVAPIKITVEGELWALDRLDPGLIRFLEPSIAGDEVFGEEAPSSLELVGA